MMTDNSPSGGLLDRASQVFILAHQLARAFQDEHGGGLIRSALDGWTRHEPTFDEFWNSLLDLREAMQTPPDGFEPVANALREAANVARLIRKSIETWDGYNWSGYAEYFPNLNSVSQTGRDAIAEAIKAQQPDDPFGFLDESEDGEKTSIDTTPMTPEPPRELIEAAAWDIPNILGNIAPLNDGSIEMEAAELAKRLQAFDHTLAAAQWSIHRSIQDGRLCTGRVVTVMPCAGVTRARFGFPEPSHSTNWRGGERRVTPIPEGKPAPFECFKVIATDTLWSWWRSFDSPTPLGTGSPPDLGEDEQASSHSRSGTVPFPKNTESKQIKKSTESGEGRAKLIAALTKHHQYAEGGCLNVEPIGNNKLAKAASVSTSTASAFFKDEFKGHSNYKTLCRDASNLTAALKLLNDEFAPHHLLGEAASDLAAPEDDIDTE